MMKWIGNLLLAIAVITGALSASTAYTVRLSADDEVFSYDGPEGEKQWLKLVASAGATAPSEETVADAQRRYEAGELSATEYIRTIETSTPIARAGDELTPELLATLRGAVPAVEHVRVDRFSFFRWPHWWVFALSAVGLFVGSMLVRAASKAEIARSGLSPRTGTGSSLTPEESLMAVRETVDSLVREAPTMANEDERLDMIIERVGELQRGPIVSFVEARPALVARFGLGGYAELMDRFAAMERQLNRSWSAAADRVYEESMDCLIKTSALIREAEAKMSRPSGG